MDTNDENKKDIGPNNEIKKTASNFGRVIKALHNKAKLPSLRTYQGDMAEFIKNKDESVVSIVIKEKEKKQKKEIEQEQKLAQEQKEKNGKALIPDLFERGELKSKIKHKLDNFQINITILVTSLVLIFGGATVSFYIFKFLKKGGVEEVVLKQEIIPYNNLITLANVTKSNLQSELAQLKIEEGISILKISGSNGELFQKSPDFFDFLGVSLPATFKRTLEDDYTFGAISQNKEVSLFIILKVDDFGRAFSAMLDWESNMLKDLFFLNSKKETEEIAATTISTTTKSVTTPKKETLVWKDIIIKNKDTRSLINLKGQVNISYTFLDKNTILIINNLDALGGVASSYASRSIVR